MPTISTRRLPVDRAIGAVQVDAAEQPHQQAADQRSLHVRHDAADHQHDHERQADERVRRLAGDRQHLVKLGRQVEHDQMSACRPASVSMSFQGPISSSVSPSLQLFVQQAALTRLPPCRRPITVEPVCGAERGFDHGLADQVRVRPARMTSAMPISCDRSLK